MVWVYKQKKTSNFIINCCNLSAEDAANQPGSSSSSSVKTSSGGGSKRTHSTDSSNSGEREKPHKSKHQKKVTTEGKYSLSL